MRRARSTPRTRHERATVQMIRRLGERLSAVGLATEVPARPIVRMRETAPADREGDLRDALAAVVEDRERAPRGGRRRAK